MTRPSCWCISAEPLRSTRTARAASGSFAALGVAAVLLALSGCRSTAPPRPLDQLTPQQQAGRAAFVANCGQCHYDRESGSLHGPSLMGVYQKPYLPSGAPANDDRIRATIRRGRNNMPPLGGMVGDAQIDDILAYLKTL